VGLGDSRRSPGLASQDRAYIPVQSAIGPPAFPGKTQ